MKRQLLLTILLISLSANAYDVYIDGIYYNLNKDAKTAEVTYDENNTYYQGGDNNYYQGEVIIPETVTSDGVDYSVTSIGDVAFQVKDAVIGYPASDGRFAAPVSVPAGRKNAV